MDEVSSARLADHLPRRCALRIAFFGPILAMQIAYADSSDLPDRFTASTHLSIAASVDRVLARHHRASHRSWIVRVSWRPTTVVMVFATR